MDRRRSEDKWRIALTPMQFHVLRQKGTERAFTGEYTDTETAGMYHCAGCDLTLFQSATKFHSGCGWPSFTAALEGDNVRTEVDRSHGMLRTEVLCAGCDGHLGHVFDDGPPPTGKRFCINSASLKLVADD
jgi:peptide-methionine (R)-S-oxide reductase